MHAPASLMTAPLGDGAHVPEQAFDLSRIYSAQDDYAALSRAVLQAMYLRPPGENLDAFFRAVALYYDDVVLYDPNLIQRYDDLLPRIDKVLGE